MTPPPSVPAALRDLVFFSYRHEPDAERWLSALLAMLEPYSLTQSLVAWSDRDIRTGEHWNSLIQHTLGRSRVAVVLLNQHFFGSDYIVQHELPRLVADARSGACTLVCVAIGPVDAELLSVHGLADFQFAHDPRLPLGSLRSQRRAKVLVRIASEIHRLYGAGRSAATDTRVPLGAGDGGPRGPLASRPTAPDDLADSPGPLLGVPALPTSRQVARSAELDALRQQLLDSPVPMLGLHAMGGFGKTTLAMALCHDDAVRRAFPDGIAWLTLGQHPDLVAALNRLLRAIDSRAAPITGVAEGSAALRAALEGRRMLCVVDDIWQAEHGRAFDGLPTPSRLLLTTRDASVLTAIGARTVAVVPLPAATARQLLAQWSGADADRLPAEAEAVIALTGGSPLALALAGAQAADGVRWTTLASQLRKGRIEFLNHPYNSIYDTLGRSVDALGTGERERYLELAVFPKGTAVPAVVVQRMWRHSAGLSEADSEQLLARLERKSLLSLSGEGEQRGSLLHDLLCDFVRLRADNLPALHLRLLEACRSAMGLAPGPAGWARMPAGEAYLWPRLAEHLAAAGMDDELEQVLTDHAWITRRLQTATRTVAGRPMADAGAMGADYAWARADTAAAEVGRALRAAAHVLRSDPGALHQQLHGRLGHADQGSLRTLAAAALAAMERSAAWAPCWPALDPPGPRGATLVGHQDAVRGAVALVSRPQLLSWSADGTVRLWNSEDGALVRTWAGHRQDVTGVAVLDDGWHAVSWSADGTVLLWNLGSDAAPRCVATHRGRVQGVHLLADGRQLVSWSIYGSILISDLEAAVPVRRLEGHRGTVHGVVPLPGGRRLLSWGEDGTLREWDAKGANLLRTFEGHDGAVNRAAVVDGGAAVVSCGADGTVRLWPLQGDVAASVHRVSRLAVHRALWLQRGQQWVCVDADGLLVVWQPATGQPPRTQRHPGGLVHRIHIVVDDEQVLCELLGGCFSLWDPSTGQDSVLLQPAQDEVAAKFLTRNADKLLFACGTQFVVRPLDPTLPARRVEGHDTHTRGALLLDDARILSWSADRTLNLWVPYSAGTARPHRRCAAVDGVLAWPPDGRRFLTWSADPTLRLWDTGLQPHAEVLRGHEGAVYGACVIGDGEQAVSWSPDDSLRLWDLRGDGAHAVLGRHRNSVLGAVSLQRGRQVLSWGGDHAVRLWSVGRRREIRCFEQHDGPVKRAVVLPGERQAASLTTKDTVTLLDLTGRRAPRALGGHAAVANGLLARPDGCCLLSWSGDGTLWRWALDAPGAVMALSGHDDWIWQVLLLSDGRRALSCSGDRRMLLWDTDAGDLLSSFDGHEAGVTGAVLLPGEGQVLSWSLDGTLRLWQLASAATCVVLRGHEAAVRGAVLIGSGNRALSWSEDHSLRLWRLSDGAELGRYHTEGAVSAVALDADETRVFVGDVAGHVQVLRLLAQV